MRRFFNWLGNHSSPKAAIQDGSGGQMIYSSQELEQAIAAAGLSASGANVDANSAMKVAAVFACVRIRSSVVANMPLKIKRRIDDRVREDAKDHSVSKLFSVRPNSWQTPSAFKRMMETHLLLRGNAYAMIVRSMGEVLALIPLHPDRVEVKQLHDLSMVYVYTRPDGSKITLKQEDVFHLIGLTLDGFKGVSVLKYARETIGLSLAMEEHGATTFKNGARPSSVLRHPRTLGKEASENLRASLDAYRTGGENEGKTLILEEDMELKAITMTAEDTQWIESRKFSRSDIAMFFGVPPHMIGDTEKSTSWGSGIDSQTQGFVTFSAEDDLTTWEETVNRDLIREDETDIFAKFNRNALVRGDLKARKDYYVAMMQWGAYSPNDVRAKEDENPREGGDVYYDPPNTAGTPNGEKDLEDDT